MVNDHAAFRVDWMPFAGLRESGLGVGGIPYTFRDMQIEKMFVGPSDEESLKLVDGPTLIFGARLFACFASRGSSWIGDCGVG